VLIDIQFEPAARAEIVDAYRWYLQRNPRIGAAFRAALNDAYRLIVEAPLMSPRYLGDTRRVILRRYPYAVIYRISVDRIQVVAVAHAKREEGYWLDR
jgi:toxin ParE1/3/4